MVDMVVQADLNRGPLIQNRYIVTLYAFLKGLNKLISDSDSYHTCKF